MNNSPLSNSLLGALAESGLRALALIMGLCYVAGGAIKKALDR